MTRYAQTNLELIEQLRDLGYAPEHLRLIGAAYVLAARLTSGLFRPSGKTFLAHLVGTASVLAEHGASPEVTAAGLLHAAYRHGDFGRVRSGPTRHNRGVIQEAVGAAVERWVYSYERLPWDRTTIDRLHRQELSTDEALVAFMRLANELEDHLDFGVLYTSTFEGRQRSATVRGPLLVDIAVKIGHPGLAAEFERELIATAQAEQ
ncbi:MAG TPA: HD domain-containing protein, partial [Acidimicrobiia bacterium]